MADTQDKLLDKEYLKIRIEELPEIKRGEVLYSIEESDNLLSKTLYVSFFVPNLYRKNGQFKGATLRISDHKIDTVHTQYIISPDKPLLARHKKGLVGTFKQTIKKALFKNVIKSMHVIREK